MRWILIRENPNENKFMVFFKKQKESNGKKKRANQRKPYKTKKRKAKNKNDFTLNFVAANPSVRKFLGGAIQAQTMFLFCPWDLQFKAFAFPGAANLFDQWHMGSTPGKETIVFGDGGLQSGSRKWGFVADPELLKQTHKIQQPIGFVKQTQMNSVVETMEVGEVWAISMGYWNSISWVLKKKDPHRLLNRGLGGVFEAEQDGFGDWKTMKINQI